jgi:hypothetical protein
MSKITVGELIEQLQLFNKDDEICFGPKDHFSFYRTKDRSGEVQIEFNETEGIDYQLLHTDRK